MKLPRPGVSWRQDAGASLGSGSDDSLRSLTFRWDGRK